MRYHSLQESYYFVILANYVNTKCLQNVTASFLQYKVVPNVPRSNIIKLNKPVSL